MPLKTLVKVGSITNLSDARYCAGMGVDLLGFRVVEGQVNYIPPKQFQEIRGWVTGPQVVAEVFGIKNQDELNAILDDYKPDYLEMGLAEFNLFSALPLPLILSLHEHDTIQRLHVKPAYLLLFNALKNDEYTYPLLLEVQSNEDVQRALNDPHIKGIAMNGSSEIRPGLKDYNALAEILEQLEVD